MKTPELSASARPRVGRPYIGNKKISFRLSPTLIKALRSAANQLGLEISEFTEKALRSYLGK